jgi:hypothetical protein
MTEPNGWTEEDWEELLLAIRHKQCTPFLGAGACAGVLPLGRDLAEEWAASYGFPFADRQNLTRVAQYVAIERGPKTPRLRIVEKFSGKGPPDFNNPNEPHRVVADLRLPIYITTNYDDFMFRALERDYPRRAPRREICQWYMARRRQLPSPSLGGASLHQNPSPDAPLVFHLHGSLENVESMVLTEDDYLDFLILLSELQGLIPPRIEEAFVASSLLFMGYSLEDMNFRVLFRKLAPYMQRNEGARHVSVQLAPRESESTEEMMHRAQKQREYLERQFGLQKVKVYWGTCMDFAVDLRKRWEAFSNA